MSRSALPIAVAAAFALSGVAGAQVLVNGPVIISEILYNSEGPEPDNEWVEIYNSGGAAVDISGWFLQDEDGPTAALPAGSMIAPGEAVIICPDLVTVTDFQNAWGLGFQVFPVAGWNQPAPTGLQNLSNSPSSTNEILTLRNAAGDIEDEVNYDDFMPWPSDPGGPSIFLLGIALDAVSNDNGANWQLSAVGTAGGLNNTVTAVFTGNDVGSPGFVDPAAGSFGHSLTCNPTIAGADVTIQVVGGTPGNVYFLPVAVVNAGNAPNGWFFGIDITLNELTAELGSPPFFGVLDASGSFLFSLPLPGAACPLGLTVDSVALEFDALTTNFVQADQAITSTL